MNNSKIRYEYEELMEHKKWIEEIPGLIFSEDWEVQIIPPFAGAVIRFRIKCGKAWVSVYLDCYDNLGICGEPYWEIYPYFDDIFRCSMKDTERLLSAINDSIEEQNKEG